MKLTIEQLLKLPEDQLRGYFARVPEQPEGMNGSDEHDKVFRAWFSAAMATPVQTEAVVTKETEKRMIPLDVNGLSSVIEERTLSADEKRTQILGRVPTLIRAFATKNDKKAVKVWEEIRDLGGYGTEDEQRIGYNTLQDDDGAILLPTLVADVMDEIGQEFGVVERMGTNFTGLIGKTKVPAVTGTLRFFAVNENGVIKARKLAFKGAELDPLKWGLISPMTNEADFELGTKIMVAILREIARAYSHLKDDVFFNADGTSNYHGKEGLLAKAIAGDANIASLDTGLTTCDDVTASFLIKAMLALPAGARAGAVYVFHPDFEFILRDLRNGLGEFLYTFNSSEKINYFAGRPVYYTESLNPYTDVSTPEYVFGAICNFDYLYKGETQGARAFLLDQAVIKDVDDSTDINLATQDGKAIRYTVDWDFAVNFWEAFAVLTL